MRKLQLLPKLAVDGVERQSDDGVTVAIWRKTGSEVIFEFSIGHAVAWAVEESLKASDGCQVDDCLVRVTWC